MEFSQSRITGVTGCLGDDNKLETSGAEASGKGGGTGMEPELKGQRTALFGTSSKCKQTVGEHLWLFVVSSPCRDHEATSGGGEEAGVLTSAKAVVVAVPAADDVQTIISI